MNVGIKLGSITHEIGTPSFLHAFHSTIAANLEPNGWGSRFPAIMLELYAGELPSSRAVMALAELDLIHQLLSGLPVSKIVWDYDDRSKFPPWGSKIASTITDLGNYFVTSTGRELVPLLRDVFVELKLHGGTARLITL
jgi:hypothetical protein